MIKNIKPKNKFLYFIVNCKKRYLALLFICIYLLLGFVFGIIYYLLCIDQNPYLIDTIFESFYLQFGLESTLLSLDIPLIRILYIIHFLLGNLWLVFIPSIIIVKLITPSEDVFLFSEVIIFYPTLHTFRVRYGNLSKMNAVNIKIEFRARIIVNKEKYNLRNFLVLLNNKNLPDARSMTPFFVSTKANPPEYFHKPKEISDYEITLHPGHLEKDITFILRLSCDYATGPYNKIVTFNYDNTHCGRFVPVQYSKEDKPNWKNVNKFILTTDTEKGKEFCKNICQFRNKCNIIDRANF